jgi:cation diffusion facilitator CzcD-associated flavoprotein CzcO
MTDRSTQMALIGAGPVGLGMAKALLEHKILYEELEADDDLGGNWFHGVYETVHIISSRKTTASYWKTLAKILEDPSATNN